MLNEKLTKIRKLDEQIGHVKDDEKRRELKKQKDDAVEQLAVDIKRIPNLFKEGKIKELIEESECLGCYLANKGLTTSQIRNVYAQVKENYDKSRVIKLRPLLAYASGRHSSVKHLQKVLDELLQDVNESNYYNFRDFFQAVLAYHRYYGGKE